MALAFHILNIILYALSVCGGTLSPDRNDVSNNELSRLVEDHRSFCRISDSCNKTVWDMDPYCYCERCSCEPDCLETDSCCPETITNLLDIPRPDVQQECVSFSYRDFDSEYHQIMFAKCPSSFKNSNENTEIVRKCERRYESSYLGDILPVDDKTTDITYANEFCAKCHSIPETNLERDWSATLKCNTSLFSPKTFDTILADINQTVDCDIVFTPKVRKYRKSCLSVISTCNMTGLWKSYDNFTEHACLAYRSTYMKKFRNPFCALCNGYKVQRYKREGTMCGIQVPNIPSFSALLQFRPEAKGDVVTVEGMCRQDQIYDTIHGVCRDLLCEFGRRLRNGSCERVFTRSNGLCYRVYVRLTSADEVYNRGNDTVLERSMNTALTFDPKATATNFEEDILRVAREYNLHNRLRNITFYKRKEQNNADWTDTIFANLFFSLRLAIGDDAGLLDSIKNRYSNNNIFLQDRDNTSKGVFKSELVRLQETDTDAGIVTPSGQIILPFYTNFNKFVEVACAKDKVITVTDFNFLPFVLLSNGSYGWHLNSSGVIIHNLDLFVESALFRETDNGSGIYVTAEVLRSAFDHVENDETESVGTEGLVGVILMSISIFCLLVTLFTYVLFPVLRSQPGINNMVLCIGLICGYLIFMFGANRINLDPGCKILGGVIHFTWMFVFFWMNVCSFHMYRVFGSLNKLKRSTNRTTVTLIYILYSVVGSAIVVGVNIGITHHISDGQCYGYGYEKTGLCYIYEPMMTLYTMTIPALCIVIVNSAMFGVAVVRCRRVANIQKHVQNDKNFFSIYIKLSTLTGMAWIVAVPMVLVQSVVFNYIFIVLNCTQGIYMMVAFTCNKRVFNMYFNQYDMKGISGLSRYGVPVPKTSKSFSTTTSESAIMMNDKVVLHHM